MKDSIFLVLIALMKALVSFTEDDASSIISCNMELLTWQEAVEKCQSKGGHMLPFETGLGQNIDALHLQSEIDIWTADQLTLNGNDEYCGFKYLNNTFYIIGEVLYGDCYANRNYFCKTETGMLDVYNSSRDKVHCNYSVSLSEIHSMRSRIKPGYYWTSLTVHGTASKASTIVDNSNNILCGAFKSSIGKYYANCQVKRYSLCSSNGEISQETTTDTTDTSTKQLITASTSVEHKTNAKKMQTQEERQSSDVWIKVVVPLGVVLILTFGIRFIIYIYRKRLQKIEEIDQPTHISNLTTVSGQSDYETLEHQQRDEHEYSSARQVERDRVAMNTYVNDIVYRADK